MVSLKLGSHQDQQLVNIGKIKKIQIEEWTVQQGKPEKNVNDYTELICFRITHYKRQPSEIPLVVQWLRICLPMQGSRVQSLVQKDPTCLGAAEPVSHNYGTWALEHRLSSCSTWTQLFLGVWDLPKSGIEPLSPALVGRFLTTEARVKSLCAIL